MKPCLGHTFFSSHISHGIIHGWNKTFHRHFVLQRTAPSSLKRISAIILRCSGIYNDMQYLHKSIKLKNKHRHNFYKLWIILWALKWVNIIVDMLVNSAQSGDEFCMFHYTWISSILTVSSWTLSTIQRIIMTLPNLFHSFLVYGKNKFLKKSILT